MAAPAVAQSALSSPPVASGLSALFSLSQAAASAPPIPILISADQKVHKDSSHQHPQSNSQGLTGKQTHALKHRRLSSTGQMRRRMSDARDAASRPSVVHTAASALASLSLTTATSLSPAQSHVHTRSKSQLLVDFNGTSDSAINGKSVPIPVAGRRVASGALAKSVPTRDSDLNATDDIDIDVEDDDSVSVVGSIHGAKDSQVATKKGKASGKKRGTTFQCESCSKIYRHPSCLIKHRWEHSPHWREASKYLLSKHQQVQVLEAAAILSHMDAGASLPEDRSLWPSYLSGGSLPPPSIATPSLVSVNGVNSASKSIPKETSAAASPSYTVSSSVPTKSNGFTARTRSGSVSTSVSVSTSAGGVTGPRMHNYTIPSGGGSGITQIRPGLLGVATPPSTNTPPTGISLSGNLPVVPYTDEEDEDLDFDDDQVQDVTELPSHSGLSMTSPSKPQPMAVPSTGAYGNGVVGSGFGAYRDVVAPGSGGFSYNSSSVSASLGGGWSLPSSDLRSGSVALSYSEVGSREGSRSDDGIVVSDDEEVDIDVVGEDGFISVSGSASGSRSGSADSVPSPTRYGLGNSFSSTGYAGYSFASRSGWKKDSVDSYRDSSHHDNYVDEGNGKSITSQVQDQEWVGMDMDMDL